MKSGAGGGPRRARAARAARRTAMLWFLSRMHRRAHRTACVLREESGGGATRWPGKSSATESRRWVGADAQAGRRPGQTRPELRHQGVKEACDDHRLSLPHASPSPAPPQPPRRTAPQPPRDLVADVLEPLRARPLQTVARAGSVATPGEIFLACGSAVRRMKSGQGPVPNDTVAPAALRPMLSQIVGALQLLPQNQRCPLRRANPVSALVVAALQLLPHPRRCLRSPARVCAALTFSRKNGDGGPARGPRRPQACRVARPSQRPGPGTLPWTLCGSFESHLPAVASTSVRLVCFTRKSVQGLQGDLPLQRKIYGSDHRRLLL